jgi:hydrophobic/amphiphilic exporter-1 (mainly G- bacteria), HAE1 family
MLLSNASIRRPVAMGCLIIALTLLGGNSYRKMSLEFIPKFDVPFVTVVTVYPGASPEEIETDIAKRIEDAVVSIDGLKNLNSVAMENVCQTMLEFNLDVDADSAAQDVREKIDLIQNDLPADAERPQILKFDIGAVPIAYLALTGEAGVEELYDYADNTLRDRISVLPGVAEVQLVGGSEREVQVQLDRSALAARGLTALDVTSRIQQEIRTIPSGRITDSGSEYSIKFDADYDRFEEIERLEVSGSDGSRCYIGDLGRVVMAADEQRQKAYLNGKPCIAIRVVKKSDANTVQVVDRVKGALAGIQSQIPAHMNLEWVDDDGAFVKASIDDVTKSVLQGVALTALILFLFLYNLRSTLIVAVSMPLSLVISMFFMEMAGYTLNVMTLLALGLSVGVLVTNSIVVLESIVSKIQEGHPPAEAARLGAHEVAVAVMASAGTNLVVLLPIGIMSSLVGLIFKPFAMTLVIVTVVSLFISFTLTPLLASLLLKPLEDRRKGILDRVEAAWNRGLDVIRAVFTRVMTGLAERRLASLLVLAAITGVFMFTMWALPGRLGFTFLSEPDMARVFIKLEFPTRYSLDRTIERTLEAERLLADLPNLKHVYTTIGKVEGIIGQSTEGVYLSQVLLMFPQKTEREEPLNDLLEMTRTRLASMPECTATVSVPTAVGGQSSPIELEISGEDLGVLEDATLRVAALSGGIDGVISPDTTVRAGKPEMRVRPNRPVLADLNTPATSLGMLMRANLEGLKAGSYKRGDRSYDIRVKLTDQEGKDQVAAFLLPGAPGRPVNLTNLASIEESVAPVQITRADKRRVAKMLANLGPNKPLGTAVDEISSAIDTRAELPPGYHYRFRGDYEMMSEGVGEMLEVALIAMFLTFLVLAAIMESFRQPFLILVTIPLGLTGTLWALYMAGESLSIFVLLGGVMLIGIVVNNAILIMDEVNRMRHEGKSPHVAIIRAASDQFRPIIMITMAAVLGMLPLALGTGLGSEMRTGIGIASIGGIIVSAVLTLVVIPLLYSMFTKKMSGKEAGTIAGEMHPKA